MDEPVNDDTPIRALRFEPLPQCALLVPESLSDVEIVNVLSVMLNQFAQLGYMRVMELEQQEKEWQDACAAVCD